MHVRLWMTLVLITGSLGCTKEAPGVSASASALVVGRVFDSEENSPVRNATVKSPTGATATTDDDGFFQIAARPGKTVLTVEESEHAKGVKEVDVYRDAESYVEMFAKPVSKDSTLGAEEGGTVKVGEMTVHVPEDALESEAGVKYSGMVTVEVATVRPEKSGELAAFPGKFDGTTINNEAGSVATRAAVSVRLLNDNGEPLRLSGSARVEIFMPIRAAFSQRSTRLWRLQEESADWAEADFGAVRDVDPIDGAPALRTAVSRLTWWNAGDPFVKSRVRGCLQLPEREGEDDPGAGSAGTFGSSPGGTGGASGAGSDAESGEDGVPRMQAPLIGDNPLAGIQVVATGIGYGYFAEKYTDDDGCVELEVKALAPVSLYAQSRRLRSQAMRVLAPATGMMRDLGVIPLGQRLNTCPGVMEECGGRCVDTLADNDNCGTCGEVCGEGVVSGEYPTLEPIHCVYGVCGCDDNQEECDGACANIETDSQHCGGCFNSCGEDVECVDSSCGACEAGFVNCGSGCVPEDPGCSVAVDDCSTDPCMPVRAESREMGFGNCCTVDGACGISTSGVTYPLLNACASTEFNAPLGGQCPTEYVEALGGIEGTGCCRLDGMCGLVLEGKDDLGCILRTDIASELSPLSCGPAAERDGGAEAGTPMVGPDASVDPATPDGGVGGSGA